MSNRAATPPSSSSRVWATTSPSRGITWSTPRSTRNPSSSGKPGAMMWAPARLASCTAKLPTPPAAPMIRMLSPSCRSSAASRRHRRQAGDGCGPGGREVHAVRLAAGLAGRDGGKLGPGAAVDIRVGRRSKAEDFLPGREGVHAGTDPLDDPREVSAEDDGKPVLGVVAHHAAGDHVVNGVDRRGADPDRQLALARLGLRQIVAKPRLRFEVLEDESLHPRRSLHLKYPVAGTRSAPSMRRAVRARRAHRREAGRAGRRSPRPRSRALPGATARTAGSSGLNEDSSSSAVAASTCEPPVRAARRPTPPNRLPASRGRCRRCGRRSHRPRAPWPARSRRGRRSSTP